MFLPYASSLAATRRPLVTIALLVVMTGITFAVTRGARLVPTFGIVPADFHFWTLFTYVFVHEGWGHWLGNVFYLWVFGAGVESAVGRMRYLLLFVLSGAVGGAMQWLAAAAALPAAASHVPIVGASAACAGLMGLFAVRYYRARLSLVGLRQKPQVTAVVSVFLVLEAAGAVYNLLSGSAAGGVAHWAHVGGFVFGLGCASLLGLSDAGSRAYLVGDATNAFAASFPGAAIQRWEHLLAKEPNNVTALAELSRAWRMLGDAEQADNHALRAIPAYLALNQRSEAAMLYVELRDSTAALPLLSSRESPLSPSDRFTLGTTLDDLEQAPLAAATLRALTVTNPDAPECEIALLRVISLYVNRLNRREEADILARLFLERYPHSQWRGMVEGLRRTAMEPSQAG